MDDLSSLLAALSPEEQSIIRPVLERDLEFQRREKERIQSIKADVPVERKESVWKEVNSLGLTVPTHRGSASSGISSGESFGSQASLGSSAISPISPLGARNCNDCNAKLGILFNSGVKCIRCHSILCELCRVLPDTEKNGSVYCKKCYRHREVLAASGEWMGIEEDQSISATILTKMRRESEHRARSPEQFRTRNMSLPPISGSNLLGLPTEQRPHSEVGDKFWKGSPSPRSPFSPYQLGIPHRRESIGSPSPRPLTPNSQPHNFIPQHMEEDEMGAFPSFDHTKERRLSWTTHTKKNRYEKRRQSEIPSIRLMDGAANVSTDSKDEEVKMRMKLLSRGEPSYSMSSSDRSISKDCRTLSSISQHDDSISLSSMEGGMSIRSLSTISSQFLNGEITLHLKYRVQSASLLIEILSCSRLPNIEGGIKPNPYVKLLLVRKGSIEPRIKHKTRSKRATNHPQFNYQIQLPNVTKSELEEHILHLSVCHRDLLQNSRVIGEVHLPLNNYPWHQDKSSFPLESKSIGIVRVRVQSITFHSSDTRIGPIVVCGKLFMGGRRIAREQSGRMRIPNPNPDSELRMLVITLWEHNGLMSSQSMGQVIVNHIQYRRNVPYPSNCSCNLCSPWYRLIDNPSLSLSFPLPLGTITLDDPSISLL
ncbi:hypothetical protein PRIPAC_83243 [Pristionchus pacificus]|uniref:C2 domain containing protein n=1 Tax=Pristionchus pacificus TaxID=54126 RepID=A0A2A6BSK8_PRIPA|nr:hypothetical protein PRIPAC_83243 [Pristionchus pacificus]|eukprot:PDM68929.1 C2 domain containing protein [Pristionchus pacificus]